MNYAYVRRLLKNNNAQYYQPIEEDMEKLQKVEGLEDSAIDINQLAKLLKNKCAAGGTVKGRTIELQGDHKKKAA